MWYTIKVCGFTLLYCCCRVTSLLVPENIIHTSWIPSLLLSCCKNRSSSLVLVSGNQFVNLTSNLYPGEHKHCPMVLKVLFIRWQCDSLSSFNIVLEGFIQEWSTHPPMTRWVRKNANSLHLSAQEKIGAYYYDEGKVLSLLWSPTTESVYAERRFFYCCLCPLWSYMAININFITIRC